MPSPFVWPRVEPEQHSEAYTETRRVIDFIQQRS